MSESTFRAVVAAVLVGLLALAVVVAGSLLLRGGPGPSPSTAAATLSGPATPGSAPPASLQGSQAAPTATGPAFSVDIVGVGLVARGTTSSDTLVLRVLESGRDAIADAAGSFRLAITDQSGDGTTVALVGTPTIEAPDSLGAKVSLAGPNLLDVRIAGSDPNNVELMTISGLGIRASSGAALGPVRATLGDFIGSLHGQALPVLSGSPGTVTAGT